MFQASRLLAPEPHGTCDGDPCCNAEPFGCLSWHSLRLSIAASHGTSACHHPPLCAPMFCQEFQKLCDLLRHLNSSYGLSLELLTAFRVARTRSGSSQETVMSPPPPPPPPPDRASTRERKQQRYSGMLRWWQAVPAIQPTACPNRSANTIISLYSA